MIEIIIHWDKIILAFEKMLNYLIAKRAYKGYCAWLNEEEISPLTYKQFRKIEYWKIRIAFLQYFAWCKKNQDYNSLELYKRVKINFKSVVFNIPY